MTDTPTRAPADPSTKDKLDALQDQLVDAVRALRSGEDWQRWLAVAARFHSYSFGNTMLILAQRPDAGTVAGYQAWKTLGRQVGKGERGIKILAPIIRRKTGADVGDADEPERPQIAGYRVTHVWDVAQTTGEPLPTPPTPKLLQGHAPDGLWDALARVVTQEGYRLERGTHGAANGYTDPINRTVIVRDDVDDAQAVKTLIHELAHVRLHASEGAAPIDCRGVLEVEAESVAYLVGASHGLDTGHYTFPYVTAWAHQVPGRTPDQVVQESGQRTLTAARWLLQYTSAPAPAVPRELVARVTAGVAVAAQLADAAARPTQTVPSPATPRRTPTKRDARLTEANAEAARFFRSHVPASWVPDYLRGRSLEAGLESPWDAGYAPAGWTTLVQHLRSQGFDERTMFDAKLVTRARTGRLIDRFRDRLILPMRDLDGTVIAFIGRAHPAADGPTPKYLNSPNSDTYVKGRYLFGLHEATPLIERGARAVLVEGPMDAIAVTTGTAGRCAGIATCGTAITPHHIRSLAAALPEADKRIAVATDADAAGESAATRLLPLLTSNQIEGLAAALPAGQDPAEVLDRHGPAALVAALTDRANPLLDHVVDGRLARHEPRLKWIEGRLTALADVAPLVALCAPDRRDAYVGELAERLQLLPRTVEGQIATAVRSTPAAGASPSPRMPSRSPRRR